MYYSSAKEIFLVGKKVFEFQMDDFNVVLKKNKVCLCFRKSIVQLRFNTYVIEEVALVPFK